MVVYSWLRGIRDEENAMHPSGTKNMLIAVPQYTLCCSKRVAVASFH